MNEIIADKDKLKSIKDTFTEMHHTLKQNSAQKAAEVILSYLS